MNNKVRSQYKSNSNYFRMTYAELRTSSVKSMRDEHYSGLGEFLKFNAHRKTVSFNKSVAELGYEATESDTILGNFTERKAVEITKVRKSNTAVQSCASLVLYLQENRSMTNRKEMGSRMQNVIVSFSNDTISSPKIGWLKHHGNYMFLVKESNYIHKKGNNENVKELHFFTKRSKKSHVVRINSTAANWVSLSDYFVNYLMNLGMKRSWHESRDKYEIDQGLFERIRESQRQKSLSWRYQSQLAPQTLEITELQSTTIYPSIPRPVKNPCETSRCASKVLIRSKSRISFHAIRRALLNLRQRAGFAAVFASKMWMVETRFVRRSGRRYWEAVFKYRPSDDDARLPDQNPHNSRPLYGIV